MLVQTGNIAAQKRKVNYGEVEVIPFVVKPSSELSIVNPEITIQVRSKHANDNKIFNVATSFLLRMYPAFRKTKCFALCFTFPFLFFIILVI